MEQEAPIVTQEPANEGTQMSPDGVLKEQKNSLAKGIGFFFIALVTMVPMIWLFMLEGLITEKMKLFKVIPVTLLMFIGLPLSMVVGLVLGNVKNDFKWFFLPHTLIVIFMLLLILALRFPN